MQVLLECFIDFLEGLKNIVLFIPRKIYQHFENYRILEEQCKKDAGIKEAYRRRLSCIKLEAERNNYGNPESQIRKIKELATTPIGNKF